MTPSFRSLLLGVVLGVVPASAQDAPPGVDDGTAVPNDTNAIAAVDPQTAPDAEMTLRTLLDAQRARVAELEAIEDRLAATDDAAQRAKLGKELEAKQLQLDAIRQRFDAIASGVDVSQSDADGPFDLKSELESLLQPLVQQLKDATEETRRIEQLRTDVDLYEQRLSQADAAIARLETLLGAVEGEQLRGELEETLDDWRAKRERYDSERKVATFELKAREDARPQLLDSAGSVISKFFRSKGMHLLVAFATFLGVFVTLRFVHRKLVEPIRTRRGVSFYARLTNVLFNAFVVLASVFAMILALFSVSDWILLVLVLIFLFGIGWTSVNLLPQFFEQVRILLNLGSVRENERLIHNGLPWRVDSLRLYTVLRNPALTGGLMRIPVQDLASMRSRPYGADEPWFPCDEGDWVRLDDGVRGRVLSQTPDMVDLKLPGGGTKAYQTASFLGLNPQNLSRGYRARIVFGIDYQHQAVCTDDVPPIMARAIRRGLLELVDESDIVKITVEFREAGASSLDYEVQADMAGSADARYEDIHRALARILVDVCNEHDWVIPFTQVTLHNAPSP